MTPSSLSEVLNGKKGLSTQRATELVSILRPKRREANAFIASVAAHHSRSRRKRIKAQSEFSEIMQKESPIRLREEQLEDVQAWYYNAILELTEVEGSKPDPHWIGRRLRLPVKVAEAALERLQQLGWLTIENCSWKATLGETDTHFDLPSRSLKNLHAQHLDRAREALNRQSVGMREFLVMTCAFNTNDLDAAKQALRDFQTDFARRFYKPEAPRNSVYQLSFQFLQLDDGEK